MIYTKFKSLYQVQVAGIIIYDGLFHFVVLVSGQSLDAQNVFPHESRHGANEETIHALGLLYLRQVHVLHVVVWKDGRAQTHIPGRVLFEIDQ